MSHPATVLIVDDDQETVETMREILADEGHRVLCAHDGREALALVHMTRPDLVLLDLNMPVMDGRSFLDAVRQDPRLFNLEVVVLSGEEDTTDIDRETVLKPLRLDTLLGLLRRVAVARA